MERVKRKAEMEERRKWGLPREKNERDKTVIQNGDTGIQAQGISFYVDCYLHKITFLIEPPPNHCDTSSCIAAL